MDQLACGSGQLIHALNARKALAVNGVGSGHAGAFAHKHSGYAHALAAQSANLLGGVVHTGLPIVFAAQRNFTCGRDLVAVIRAGVGQQNQQMPLGRALLQKLPGAAQGQPIAVPPGGKIRKNVPLGIFIAVVL